VAALIPDKIYFKIGEVAELVGVKAHVLRYWEAEFNSLKPVKSRTNQRLYRREDIEQALLIKSLLYEQGFTVSGARHQLKQSPSHAKFKDNPSVDFDSIIDRLRHFRDRLKADIDEAGD